MTEIAYTSRVMKSGNALYMVLPRCVVAKLGWKRKDLLAATIHGDAVTLRRVPLERMFGHVSTHTADAARAGDEIR